MDQSTATADFISFVHKIRWFGWVTAFSSASLLTSTELRSR